MTRASVDLMNVHRNRLASLAISLFGLTPACGGSDASPCDGAACSEQDLEMVVNEPGQSDEVNTVLGAPVTPPPPPAPTHLRTFVGGDSIALRWTNLSTEVVENRILRNGKVVAKVKPGHHDEFPEAHGNGFIDHDLLGFTIGLTFTYQVQAVYKDGRVSEPSASVTAIRPKVHTPVPTVVVDTVTTPPDLVPWLRDVGAPLIRTWYPKVAEVLARPVHEVPNKITLAVDPAYDGVAYCSGTRIVVAEKWARSRPDGTGVFLHESTHVLQQYPQAPLWIVEGLADWTNIYMAHDRETILLPDQSYTEGYAAGAYFLDWIQSKYNPEFVRKLSIAAKSQYRESLFVELVGKTVAQLWQEFRTASFIGPAPIKAADGKCLHSGPKTADCTVKTTNWTLIRDYVDGTFLLSAGERGCVNVAGGAVADGTRLVMASCNADRRQRWTTTPEGKLMNPQSGRCIAEVHPGTSIAVMELRNCSDASARVFALSSVAQ
jgi:hypothetical protein